MQRGVLDGLPEQKKTSGPQLKTSVQPGLCLTIALRRWFLGRHKPTHECKMLIIRDSGDELTRTLCTDKVSVNLSVLKQRVYLKKTKNHQTLSAFSTVLAFPLT